MKIKFDACIYKMQLVDHDISQEDRLLKFIDETPYKETLVDERDPSTKWGIRISKCAIEFTSNKNDRDWYKL